MNKRLKYLDCLRATAVLLVMFHHSPKVAGVTPLWVHGLRRFGWTGVDMFFVLSGFLVSGLLFREYKKHGNVQLGRFLIRRGLKIYPAFYTFLLITTVIRVMGGMHLGVQNVLAEALFVQNYWSHYAMWIHTWSLAVEEHFYLLLGLCIYVRARHHKRSSNLFQGLARVFVFVALFCFAWRVGVVGYALWTKQAFEGHYNGLTHFWTHARLDSLGFGVVLSYWFNFHGELLRQWIERRRTAVLLASLALLTIALPKSADSILVQTIGFPLLYLGYGGILMLAVHAKESSGLAFLDRPLNWLSLVGSHSYSLYLWHVFVLNRAPAFVKWLSGRQPSYGWTMVVFFVGTIVLGITMSKLVEVPFLKLRDRFFPSRSGGIAPADQPKAASVAS